MIVENRKLLQKLSKLKKQLEKNNAAVIAQIAELEKRLIDTKAVSECLQKWKQVDFVLQDLKKRFVAARTVADLDLERGEQFGFPLSDFLVDNTTATTPSVSCTSTKNLRRTLEAAYEGHRENQTKHVKLNSSLAAPKL